MAVSVAVLNQNSTSVSAGLCSMQLKYQGRALGLACGFTSLTVNTENNRAVQEAEQLYLSYKTHPEYPVRAISATSLRTEIRECLNIT